MTSHDVILRPLIGFCTHTRGSRCLQCACHTSPSHPLHFLTFDPSSLLFPHGHFDTSFPSAPSLPNCSRSKRADPAHFRTSGQEFGCLADPAHSTGYEPEEFDKNSSADGDTTPINDPNYDNISDFSKITRENTGPFGVSTMLEAFVSHIYHGGFALQRESKESIPQETVARQRQEREGAVISVTESMSKKCRPNSIRSHSLQTHREFYSDERDLRGHLERRAQQAILDKKIQFREHYTRLSTTRRSKISERRNSEYALLESQRQHECQRLQLLEDIQWTDQVQRERTHLCSEVEMKNRLHQECNARSCQ